MKHETSILDLAQALAVTAYDLANALPEDEKWGVASRLRSRAFDLTQDCAEAAGSIDPRDKKWQYGHARRDAFGLRNAISMYARLGYGEAQIDALRTLENITDAIDAYIAEASDNIPKWFAEMTAPEDAK